MRGIAVGSTLARITDLCSDVAIRLIAPPRRNLKLASARRERDRKVENRSYLSEKLASVCSELLVQADFQHDACADFVCAGGRVEDVAAFVRDLEALRLRMLRAAFEGRVDAPRVTDDVAGAIGEVTGGVIGGVNVHGVGDRDFSGFIEAALSSAQTKSSAMATVSVGASAGEEVGPDREGLLPAHLLRGGRKLGDHPKLLLKG